MPRDETLKLVSVNYVNLLFLCSERGCSHITQQPTEVDEIADDQQESFPTLYGILRTGEQPDEDDGAEHQREVDHRDTLYLHGTDGGGES